MSEEFDSAGSAESVGAAENPVAAMETTTDWTSGISEEVRDDPLIQDMSSLEDLAKGYVHAQHMIGRHAILQAMRPAGVLTHVPTQGSDLLAGRIRRIEEAVLGKSVLKLEVGDTGLDDSCATLRGYGEDPVHPCQADDHSPVGRHTAAREARPETARNVGNARIPGRAHDASNFLRVSREHHRARPASGL